MAHNAHKPHHTTPRAGASLGKENADLLMQTAQRSSITDPKELANFMGQMQVESQGFTRMHENLNYSPERLLEKFSKRSGLETLEQATAIVDGGRQQVAEAIYGGDWGKRPGSLGNTEPGDGYKFHGRGFVHLTGRSNYEHYGKALGLDLVSNPEWRPIRRLPRRLRRSIGLW